MDQKGYGSRGMVYPKYVYQIFHKNFTRDTIYIYVSSIAQVQNQMITSSQNWLGMCLYVEYFMYFRVKKSYSIILYN